MRFQVEANVGVEQLVRLIAACVLGDETSGVHAVAERPGGPMLIELGSPVCRCRARTLAQYIALGSSPLTVCDVSVT